MEKEFYVQVLQEYLESNTTHLCFGSKTFKNQWFLNKEKIKKDARHFLSNYKSNINIKIGYSYLFVCNDHKIVRKDFLKFMLK